MFIHDMEQRGRFCREFLKYFGLIYLMAGSTWADNCHHFSNKIICFKTKSKREGGGGDLD